MKNSNEYRKSIRLNQENPIHQKAIKIIDQHGRGFQTLVISLLLDHEAKLEAEKRGLSNDVSRPID